MITWMVRNNKPASGPGRSLAMTIGVFFVLQGLPGQQSNFSGQASPLQSVSAKAIL